MSAAALSRSGKSVAAPIRNGCVQWTASAGNWTLYIVAHVFRTSPTRLDTNPNRVKDGSQWLEDYLDPAKTAQYLAVTANLCTVEERSTRYQHSRAGYLRAQHPAYRQVITSFNGPTTRC